MNYLEYNAVNDSIPLCASRESARQNKVYNVWCCTAQRWEIAVSLCIALQKPHGSERSMLSSRFFYWENTVTVSRFLVQILDGIIRRNAPSKAIKSNSLLFKPGNTIRHSVKIRFATVRHTSKQVGLRPTELDRAVARLQRVDLRHVYMFRVSDDATNSWLYC